MKTSENIIIRYDGAILADHRMDISDLAPALIGISELCKITNSKFNDEKASIKVLMKADIEQKCIQLDLNVVLSTWDGLKSFISDNEIKSAKELLEWIGIIGGTILGAIKLSSYLENKRVDSIEYAIKDGKDIAIINIQGDNNTVNNIVYAYKESVDLLKDEKAVSSIKKIVSPVVKEGYEVLEFESENKIESITKSDAAAIINFDSFDKPNIDDAQMITAWVTPYAPVYDKDKTKWKFRLGEAIVNMDISETNIAEGAMQRGASLMSDAYHVKLELKQEYRSNNRISTEYKIKKVLEFRPGTIAQQESLFHDESEES